MDSADNADHRSEAEIQVLIAHLELEQPIETPNNIGYSFYPQDLKQAARYFRRAVEPRGADRRTSRGAS